METGMRADRNPQTSGNGRHPCALPSTEGAAAPDRAEVREHAETKDPDSLQRLLEQIRALGEYVSYSVAARTDSLKLGLREAVLAIALGALAFVLIVGLSIAAGYFVLSGLAGGLSVLFGDRAWLGNLVAGLLLLAGLGGGLSYSVARHGRTARERTVDKYEERRARQKKRFGRSVSDGFAVTSPDE
jgi:hypothetical protein